MSAEVGQPMNEEKKQEGYQSPEWEPPKWEAGMYRDRPDKGFIKADGRYLVEMLPYGTACRIVRAVNRDADWEAMREALEAITSAVERGMYPANIDTANARAILARIAAGETEEENKNTS